MKKIITILLVIFYGNIFSQDLNDLLLNYNESKSKLEKIQSANSLGIYYESISDYPNALKYLYVSKNLNSNYELIDETLISFNYLGYVYWHMSLYDSSLLYHSKALQIAEKKKLENENTAFTFLMLGNDYYDKGDFKNSAQNYFKCIKLSENKKYKSTLIQALNRLSKLYFKMKDYSLAREYVTKALNFNQFSDTREVAVSYNNLGNITLQLNHPDSALFYFSKTLINFQKCGDVIGQSIASINLGDTYLELFNRNISSPFLDSSKHYYQKSYILNKRVDNKFGMIYGLWGIADINVLKSKYSDALPNYKEALMQSKIIGAKSEELNLYLKIHTLFDSLNVKDSSLFYLKRHIVLKNQVESSEQTKQLLKQESKYEYEKLIEKEKQEIEKQKLLEREKNKWKNIILTIVVLVALALIFVIIDALRKLKIIKNKNEIINAYNEELNQTNEEILAQRDEIERQKKIVDEQNYDIKASITYAKRIQNAILPPNSTLEKYLKDHFVFYQPKEIVAGDFYWFESVGNTVYLAVADCTGHGVPGAMVSVVCHSALNRSIREYGLQKPSEILDKTRELVIETFQKSEEQVKDGMDIALIAWDAIQNKLEFSGANNPLYLVRNNDIEIIKGDKQPIGFSLKTKPFTNHTIDMDGITNLFLFTDGIADQFGGEKGKKMGYNVFREYLLKIYKMNSVSQKSELISFFNNWKGKEVQVDDVCVISVKIIV